MHVMVLVKLEAEGSKDKRKRKSPTKIYNSGQVDR